MRDLLNLRGKPLSHSGDVGGEEVDVVPVEVASGSVVVLRGSGVGMAREDLRVAQRDTSIEGLGGCRMP